MYPGPDGQWQPPQQQSYRPPAPYSYQPPPPPPPRRVRHVERQRGLGGMATGVHVLLTVCTCGAWLLVWLPWWLFRMVVPRRKSTTHYYR